MAPAGSAMAADMSEQPDTYARLLDATNSAHIAEVAAQIARRRPRRVTFTARGTSAYAARYGSYLAEIRLGLPAGIAAPSTVTLFGAEPGYADELVIGVSQSGRSPDLCEVVAAARRAGASTVAITNDPTSPLAAAAEFVIDLAAGVERALPATKTYTAELLALLLLIEGIRAGDGALPRAERDFLDTLPELARRTLADTTATEIAPRYRFATSLVTTGRGYGYPTAMEVAHKIMETSALPVLAYSGADLLHGPVAIVNPGVPVLLISGTGPGGAAMGEVLARLTTRNADVLAVGATDLPGTVGRLPVPEVDERYAPLLDILPLQRLTLALALVRGCDPDAPEGITKVTPTR